MRKSRLIVLAAMLIAAWATGGDSQAQEKTELRLNLQKGQRFEQVMLVQQKMSQTLHKVIRIDVTVNSRTELQTEVLDVKDDGSAELKATYKKVTARVTSNPPGLSEELNRDPSLNPLTVLTGQSITYTVNRQGQVQQIDGLDPIIQRMLDTQPLFTTNRKQLSASFKKSIEELSKQNTGLTALPEHAVGIGDTWELEPDVDFSGPITNQLISHQNGIATIASRSKLNAYPILPSMDMPENTNLSFALSGINNALARIDQSTGWPREMEIHQRLSGKATIKNTDDKQLLFSWPLYMKITIRIAGVTPPH